MFGQSFIFGEGTPNPTYESLRKRREIVDLLKEQSVARTPKNMWEGIDAVGKALLGRYADSKLAPQEDAERKRISDILGGLGAGSTVMGAPIGPIAGAQSGFTGLGYSGNPASLAPAPEPAGAPVAPAIGGPGGAIYDGLIARGLPEPVAQGFMMNFADESGMNPGINERAPAVPGSRGGFGLAQWTGPRRVALEQFATEHGRPVDDADTQLDYLMTELQGPEAAAAQQFMGESDPGQAAAEIAQYFLRPAPEHLERRVAEYTGGSPGMDMMGMAGFGQPDMGMLSQLAEVVGNPYASEGQKMVAQALIEREIGKGSGDALGWARLALDREKMKVGNKGAYGLQPVYTKDAEGNLHAWQMKTEGGWQEIPLPEGQEFAPGTSTIQLPTEAVTIDKRSGETVRVDEKDVAGEAAQTEVGKSAGTAAAGLGDKELSVQAAIDHAERIITNPNLSDVTGGVWGRLPANPLNQDDTNLVEDIKGISGKVFSNAIDALRGLGAMTEAEGQAARDALANISRIQDAKQLAAELKRFQEMLKGKLEVARRKAAQVNPNSSTDVPDGVDPETWKYMPEDMKKLWVR